MKVLIVGLTTAILMLAALLFAGTYKSIVARQPSAAKVVVTQVSQSADRQPTLKSRIVRDATKDRWWMLLVGLTVVAYRLRQKHRALFENSLLYTSHEDFEICPPARAVSLDSEFEEIPQGIARAG